MGTVNDIINPIEGKKEFNHGSYGVIYENDDGSLTKVMRFDTIDPYPMIKIKELNLKNFYKIYDILVQNNGTYNYLKAYKMNKIVPDDTTLLDSKIDYFVTNIRIIMESLKVLSDNYILSYDLHDGNIIINKNSITVIDCDSYKYNPEYPKELIYNHNLEEFKRTIFEQIIKELPIISIIRKRKLKELFRDNDLDSILNKVSSSNSINEYLKK